VEPHARNFTIEGKNPVSGLEAVIAKAIAKNPDDRPQTGTAVVTAINELLVTRFKAPTPDEDGELNCSPKFWTLCIALALSAVGLGVGGFLFWAEALAWRKKQPGVDESPRAAVSRPEASGAIEPSPSPALAEEKKAQLQDLRRRAARLRDALLHEDLSYASKFVDPSLRGSEASLGDLAGRLKELKIISEGTLNVAFQETDHARVTFLLRRENGSDVRLALDWILRNGEWYVAPSHEREGK